MKKTSRLLGVLAGAALFAAGTAGYATAVPDSSDGTVKVPVAATPVAKSSMTIQAVPPSDCRPVVESSYAISCYEYSGDDQWIRDKVANGWQAVVHVQTNYGKNRYCGALPAADGWGECLYDHREEGCVRFRFYELKDGQTRNWTEFSRYYQADSGLLC